MTICTAYLPTTLEVPPMSLHKPLRGHTGRVTPRVLAESLWVTGCVICGAFAQVLSNLTTPS